MKARKYVLTPVEKAVARAKWRSHLSSAGLQALMGEDVATVVDKVATILYIVGLACHKSGLAGADVDAVHRGCRAALGAVSGEGLDRAVLDLALQAAERLRGELSELSLAAASVDASARIKAGSVNWSDFAVFVDAGQPTVL